MDLGCSWNSYPANHSLSITNTTCIASHLLQPVSIALNTSLIKAIQKKDMPQVLWLICICSPEIPAIGTAYALFAEHVAISSVSQLLAVKLHCLTYCHEMCERHLLLC